MARDLRAMLNEKVFITGGRDFTFYNARSRLPAGRRQRIQTPDALSRGESP